MKSRADESLRNDSVKSYWEQEACGTHKSIIGERPADTKEWFRRVEEHRYTVEPFIHSIAQFTRHSGKTILEVGVGAGTDHLQWARAGLKCYGVDLTQRAIDTTRTHLSLYGFTSNLGRIDAEKLPFTDDYFDLVYSWGVIHHSSDPQGIIDEIRRVLKPQGMFLGMMYGRFSLVSFKLWIQFGLLRAKPWMSLAEVIANHMESPGTKAYTRDELKSMFSSFDSFQATPLLTTYDCRGLPSWICRFIPDECGWFIALKAVK